MGIFAKYAFVILISGIPRPVKHKPHNRPHNSPNKNVPHISSAITPSVSEKPVLSKPNTSSTHKGPVVANHDIQLNTTNSTGWASLVNFKL